MIENKDAMQPRSLLELNTFLAIVAVLDKPRWWVKWREDEVRVKWLNEIQELFLGRTFAETLVNWRYGQQIYRNLYQILEQPEQAGTNRDALVSWLRRVVTDCGVDADERDYEDCCFYEAYEEEDDIANYYYESDDESYNCNDYYDDSSDEEDDDEHQTKRQKLGTVEDEHRRPVESEEQREARRKERHELKRQAAKVRRDARILSRLAIRRRRWEPYSYIKWTLNQLQVYESLRAIPFNEWELSRVQTIVKTVSIPKASNSLNARCVSLLRRLLRDGVTTENLKAALPLPGDDQVIDTDKLAVLVYQCERIESELKAVEAYVTQWIDLTLAQLGIDNDAPVVVAPLGVPGVFLSDNMLSTAVKEQFEALVKRMEDVPEEQKDWHPLSNNQVLDLVHPSLYCCVHGKTLKLSTRPDREFESPLEQMQATIFAGTETVEGSMYSGDSFQWIPTDFRVEDDGSVRILSYINNLHPKTHRKMYDSISAIVSGFVPMFEKMLSAARKPIPPPAFDASNIMDHCPSSEIPQRPKVPTDAVLPDVTPVISLRSTTLQIIVKIAEIVLTPENPKYESGSWHVEGTEQERIIGTGLYYFGCDNISESRLSFRSEVKTPHYQQSDHTGVTAVYGFVNSQERVQQLGSVSAVNDRCVVFPNRLQHQPFELTDKSRQGTRKVLALFLVDPDAPVLSTSDIPAQQHEWKAMELPLNQLKLSDVVQNLVQTMVVEGMTLEQANGYRLKLMDERKPNQDGDSDRYFGLCEH